MFWLTERLPSWSISAARPLVPGVPLLQDRTWEWDWSMHPMFWMWSVGGVAMILMMLAFWAVVVTGIIVTIRWLVRQAAPPTHTDAALDILRQRYARGEIDRQEFESRRRDLESTR